MRLKGKNTIDVEPDRKAIVNAIKKQIAHGHYSTEYLYGSGGSGEISEILSKISLLNTQKINSY